MAPYKEKEIEKLFYSIGEVASKFQVNTSLIRFWENEFDILKPKKNKKGNRLFTKEDIVNIEKIFTLVKQEGYTISGAKKALKANIEVPKNHTFSTQKTLEHLKRIQTRLNELKTTL